jgi:hypothetical protein
MVSKSEDKTGIEKCEEIFVPRKLTLSYLKGQ